MRRGKTRAGRKCGQSLIESCLAIVLVCLVLAGLFQLSQLFAAKEVLDYSASRAARAKTVGFNHWMVLKAGKVAAIPNAGIMLEPVYTNEDLTLRGMIATRSPGGLWDWALGEASPSSEQYEIERVRIPEFLEAANDERAYYVLDYADWDTVDVSVGTLGGPTGTMLHARAVQDFPLRIPMHRSFYDDDEVDLGGDNYIEKHYSLYLRDLDW